MPNMTDWLQGAFSKIFHEIPGQHYIVINELTFTFDFNIFSAIDKLKKGEEWCQIRGM